MPVMFTIIHNKYSIKKALTVFTCLRHLQSTVIYFHWIRNWHKCDEKVECDKRTV